MILAIIGIAALGFVGFKLYEKYGSSATVANIKSEIAKIEAEAQTEAGKLSADAKAIILRLKSLL